MTEHSAEKGLPHLLTENSGECSTCWEPWPCAVAVAWDRAHDIFCPRGWACSTHTRPGDRYVYQQTRVFPPDNGGAA